VTDTGKRFDFREVGVRKGEENERGTSLVREKKEEDTVISQNFRWYISAEADL